MATASQPMSLKKKIIIGVLIALTLGLAAVFFLKRKAAPGAGTGPETPTDERTGATPGTGATGATPNAPTPPPAPGLTPPTQAAVTQAASGNVPDVPSSYRLDIFSNGMDWRTFPPIKAQWDQRAAALKALFVAPTTADQDAAFLMQAAKILGNTAANGVLFIKPALVQAAPKTTIGWEGALIYSQFVKQALSQGISLPKTYKP